jgi:cell wall-associated NlpC family hydrolase
MNVLRNLFLLSAVGLAVSCNTFKPVSKQSVSYTSGALNNSATPSNPSPRFLETSPSAVISQKTTVAHHSAIPAVSGTPRASFTAEVTENTTIKGNAAAPAIEYSHMLQFKYAIIMDVPVEQLTNLELLSFIDEWYGTRYRFGGTSKYGIDCSSLMQKLYSQVYNREIPRTAVTQYGATRRIAREDLQQGDLVFFHTTRRGISHVGFYLGNNKFVHASSSRGVVISDLTESYYVNAYRGGGRFEDAAPGDGFISE